MSSQSEDDRDLFFLFRPLPWILLCVLCYSYNLGTVPPYHSDESYYIESVKTMVQTGDYLTPYYHENKRFAKPILIYWLMAIPYKLFGINTTSARSVSVFLGLAHLGLIYLLAKRLFDSRAALICLWILPGTYMHFQISRWATTDMALSFFILLALYCFVRFYQNPAKAPYSLYGFYVAMGLGFLIKGPPALLIPVITITGFYWESGQLVKFKEMKWGIGCLILALISLPWFIAMVVLHGDEFTNHLLGAEVRDRIANDAKFSLYYFGVIIRYYLPWSLFFLSALVLFLGITWNESVENSKTDSKWKRLWKNIKYKISQLRQAANHSLLFCLIWLLGTLILFTLLRIEHSRYMLPSSSAIVLILGYFFSNFKPDSIYASSYFKVPLSLTLLLFLGIAIAHLIGFPFFLNLGSQHLTGGFKKIALVGLSVFIIVAVVCCGKLFIKKRFQNLVASLALIQLILMASLHGDLISFYKGYPLLNLAQSLNDNGNKKEKVGLYKLDSYRSKLEVMTAHPVFQVNDLSTMKIFTEKGSTVYILMRVTDWKTRFRDWPFKAITQQIHWKKIRLNSKMIQSIRENGISKALEPYSETLVLLSSP